MYLVQIFKCATKSINQQITAVQSLSGTKKTVISQRPINYKISDKLLVKSKNSKINCVGHSLICNLFYHFKIKIFKTQWYKFKQKCNIK